MHEIKFEIKKEQLFKNHTNLKNIHPSFDRKFMGIHICCLQDNGLPNQGLARTKEIGERIRGYVAKATDFPCTFKVSVGVAIYKGGDYHVTINLADKALRFAKENDVDMVVAYEDM